jgi:hypothetical protein
VDETQAWLEANAKAAQAAVTAAQDELYDLLGGRPDPARQREALAAEVARLKLTIKRSRKS